MKINIIMYIIIFITIIVNYYKETKIIITNNSNIIKPLGINIDTIIKVHDPSIKNK